MPIQHTVVRSYITTPIYTKLCKVYTDPQATPLEKQALQRIHALTALLLDSLGSIGDTALSVMMGCCSVLTLGLHKETVELTREYLNESRFCIVRPCAALLQFLNPDAYIDSVLAMRNDGCLTGYVRDSLFPQVLNCVRSPSWTHKHITSRLMHLVLLVASVVTRVADGVIGAIAMGAACCTLGQVSVLNHVALSALQSTGLIKDIFTFLIGFLNPDAVSKKFPPGMY